MGPTLGYLDPQGIVSDPSNIPRDDHWQLNCPRHVEVYCGYLKLYPLIVGPCTACTPLYRFGPCITRTLKRQGAGVQEVSRPGRYLPRAFSGACVCIS